MAGFPWSSGGALGVDSAAHAGALEGAGLTIAVLAGGADVPYPASKRRLHAEILRRGAVVSELPPGFRAHRWCFVARNRLIAALATVVVIVEGTARSGSLITAGFAADLGRTVGAVPGQVTSRLAAGTNALLADGAPLIREAADVLDHLPGMGETARAELGRSARVSGLSRELDELLAAIEAGHGTLSELAVAGREPRAVLHGLTELEVRGFVRRGFGGRYVRAA
jgi:DNA processing protein